MSKGVPLCLHPKCNASGRGLPNLYFCCHSTDLGRYFTDISNDILKILRCNIWYADPSTPRDQEFWDDLALMDLFVVPITADLLHTANTAIEQELPFALRHNKPILPLMQEQERQLAYAPVEPLFHEQEESHEPMEILFQEDNIPVAAVTETEQLPEDNCSNNMTIRFGTEVHTDAPVMWLPNDTNQITHINMGIIGTMGTGKTQFTKSVITQLYRNQEYNFGGQPLGILIFDYKGILPACLQSRSPLSRARIRASAVAILVATGTL